MPTTMIILAMLVHSSVVRTVFHVVTAVLANKIRSRRGHFFHHLLHASLEKRRIVSLIDDSPKTAEKTQKSLLCTCHASNAY